MMNELSYEVLATNFKPSGAMTLKEAISLATFYVPKPRFSIPKAKMADVLPGGEIKVTSRVKGCKDYAIIEVSLKVEPIIEEAKPKKSKPKKAAAPKKAAKPKKNIPAGIRAASWNWIVELLAVTPEVTEVEVQEVTEKRFNLLLNGEKVWYSSNEETANTMATAIANYCEKQTSV